MKTAPTMKLTILTDMKNEILGMFTLDVDAEPHSGAPTKLGIVPLQGQKVYELEVPLEVAHNQSVTELRSQYLLTVRDGEPKLVSRAPAKKTGRSE